MCGICGYISPNNIDEQQLWDMTNTLTHRGPDDSGIWQHENAGIHIGFGHRRLSIFDLSQLGHQPMQTGDGSLTVTYNGEIYNFLELRKELEKEGCRFRSNCDTEVLLYAYRQWGDDFVKKLNGMFAFVIYDKKRNRAVFARDRIGKKPLYYYHNGHTLIFASQLKAIMKHPGFKKDINTQLISSYLIHMYYCSPDTVFENTYKLEPGYIMIWESGAVKKQKYWDLLEKYTEKQASPVTDIIEAKDGLRACLKKSVEQRLAADVPVGVFQSGGIDSTLVSGTAAKLSDKPIKTFTIGFYEESYNEAERVKKITQHLGTDHTELYVAEEDILSLTAGIPEYFDEPFADSSQIPTMMVSRLAKQDVTVALTGDGGDEFFCGYLKYDRLKKVQALNMPATLIHKIINLPGISKLHIDRKMPATMRALVNNSTLDTKVQYYTGLCEEITSKIVKGSSQGARFSIEGEISCTDWKERKMLLDILTSLPDQMLCKTDRASMRYALELRSPLLDIDVAEYSFTIPMSLKHRAGEKKWILKQLAYELVPQEILDMPKQGFSVPMTKWLKGPLKHLADKYTDKEILARQDIFNYEPLAALVEKVNRSEKDGLFSTLLWSFLMFQMWYQQYIEDLW